MTNISMAKAKRRTVTVDIPGQGKKEINQYYCDNCDEWFEPRNKENPDWPQYCKGCNTVLHYD
jgi:formylmethanofuran dehydrogenase subunit E